MEQFADYAHAMVSIALFVLVVLILNFMTAVGKGNADITSGAGPAPDYSNRLYRIDRAFENSVQSLAMFFGAVGIAMLAGASPFWVNLLASVGVVSRFLMVFVHVQGIGAARGGPRTMLYIFGWFLNLILVLLAIWAVFS